MNEILYKNLNKKYEKNVLDLLDDRLGDNYITQKELKNIMEQENGITQLAIDSSKDKVVGVCILSQENLGSLEDKIRIPLIRSFNMDEEPEDDLLLGHIKSVVVHQNYGGKGIGTKMFGKTVEKACKNWDVNRFFCLAWKKHDASVPLKRVLENNDFTFSDIVVEPWYDDKNYICPECNGPCYCQGELYCSGVGASANACLKHGKKRVKNFSS